mmetsp:Transcript_18676/g.27817  ORF Transcript_18676/g.27817 Transcript_18676/m.27817 type:complete len:181 (+) Transcript_18676:22-564(+)
MGNITPLSHIFGAIKKETRILIIGLDGCGKTTILYKLKLGEVVTTQPTDGFNVESVQHKQVEIVSFDLGSEEQQPDLWKHYFAGTRGLIYVVDSNDHNQIKKAAEELDNFLKEDELKNCTLLVLANKQDLPDVISLDEIRKQLRLDDISNREWYIQATSATNGEGLMEGLDWMCKLLAKE